MAHHKETLIWTLLVILGSGTGCPGDKEPVEAVDESCEEAEMVTRYADRDGDGYGDPKDWDLVCEGTRGWIEDDTDCDDQDDQIYPGADERCNEEDDDCDALVDEALPAVTVYLDQDRDNYGDSDVSREGCGDLASWSTVGGDCLDSDRGTHPDAEENCEDGWDRDCDGLVDCEDEDCAVASVCGEVDCEDGLDDDDDGYTDCDDDECWGLEGCPAVLTVRVVSGERALISESSRDWWWFDVCGSTSIRSEGGSSEEGHFAWGIRGEVRRYAPDASAVARCDWGLNLAAIGFARASLQGPTMDADTWSSSFNLRTGFWIAGGCGLGTSDFLPPLSSLQDRWTHWYEGAWSNTAYGDGHDASSSGSGDCQSSGYSSRFRMNYTDDLRPGERRAWTTEASEILR